ncbi:DUF2080 family transposase-associated protein [Halobacterium sp. KA-4]|uniref:DUF2080 family transposase-associated protein n=1 Tax=Halobacterium sp. KA-4 TaxID=2896367 RepID=UPI001E3FBEE3|nr:DUF2080 family transposase-associated protein [Halobacterium sp. KA-4]MCD2200955.1 DUF2080 family transposase-associated protein [Halobacterium sp. KA-4]
MADDDTQLEREVKEFGNGAHATVPREWLGETVVIRPAEENSSKALQPPITTEKLHSTLKDASREDFTREIRNSDNYPREGEYQYDHDLRLSIDVELVYENDTAGIHDAEEGRVTHLIDRPTEEELLEHTEWWDTSMRQPETLGCIDPAVSGVLDQYGITYGDLYHYTIKWNGGGKRSFDFSNRLAAEGRFYLPIWSRYDSLQDYKDSSAYRVATALTEAPEEDYLKYLNTLTERGINWGEREKRDGATRDVSREDILEESTIPAPK